eukprot:CAMPEP_0196596658 /NCGR_PEP_ID=MMETSP1081-20130531/87214_1 /TAXON_ID=36882 /ORGANISM="Pyramimonas amylifera, Strain CCMP720" /LENGTH=38 /DNA_ID= /DNA_START= /DNA_END= /DNA_ORIENTATION=
MWTESSGSHHTAGSTIKTAPGRIPTPFKGNLPKVEETS